MHSFVSRTVYQTADMLSSAVLFIYFDSSQEENDEFLFECFEFT